MEKTVALLTDFSEASDEAFARALALALAYKHHFYLPHVKNPERDPEWSSFPQVRETLARWGVIHANAAQSEVETKLGIKVAKVEIDNEDIPGGILDFVWQHPTNVIVMATRGRQALDRLRLERILIPVAHNPSPISSLRSLMPASPIGHFIGGFSVHPCRG